MLYFFFLTLPFNQFINMSQIDLNMSDAYILNCNQNILIYDFNNFINLNDSKDKKESILSRSENIFFLLLPLLYFYLSNIVKFSKFLSTGTFSDSFTAVENRFIWGSILAISINIIVHDIFI